MKIEKAIGVMRYNIKVFIKDGDFPKEELAPYSLWIEEISIRLEKRGDTRTEVGYARLNGLLRGVPGFEENKRITFSPMVAVERLEEEPIMWPDQA